ncbi:MAG: hypothetical protein MUO89_00885 [Dehalococcoidia bacterium]|nr:hypothetical protein [Dehalococcoidia bacterium]
MATVKLIGADAGGFGAPGANNLMVSRFQSVASAPMTEFKVYANANGNVKAALYADNSGAPGALIAAVNTGQAVTGGGWNTLTFPSTNLVSGTYYWLATIHDTASAVTRSDESGARKYVAYLYSNSFPSPAPSSWDAQDSLGMAFAGWGSIQQTIIPSSISQAIGYGTPKLNLSVKPSSILQALSYGTPTVLTSALIIQPLSIVQPIVIGMPTLKYSQILSPSSIVQLVVVGTPWVGIFGFIEPQSIIQPVVIGTPTVLKYVWHVILDGQYATETPRVNRAYIIGRDQYGNPVYGTAINTDEVALAGERLDFQPDSAIPTTAQAADVASAVLAKMRLLGKRGVILIPPNCGQELFDVVQISDSGANQSAVKFRVVGIRFEYNPRQAKYEHKLILGAP